MSDVINAFLLVFAALFPIVNPLGSAPIFLSLTASRTDQERTRLARGVAVNGFWLLLGSLLCGSEILEFFGITVPVVRVAGGLLVTTMGWKLLNEGGEPPERQAVHQEEQPITDSFYPLTMPLTVGPGSISVALTIGAHRSPGETPTHTAILVFAAVAGLVAIAATIYVCYRFAGELARFLGATGINVMVRLSAFILTCIGVQIAWSGIGALLATLPH